MLVESRPSTPGGWYCEFVRNSRRRVGVTLVYIQYPGALGTWGLQGNLVSLVWAICTWLRGLEGSTTAMSPSRGPPGPRNTAPNDHFRSCSAVRSQPRRVVSSQRVRAGVGDETVPSSRESGMTGFLPGAPARALFVCESPPPTVMIVSSRGLHGRMT